MTPSQCLDLFIKASNAAGIQNRKEVRRRAAAVLWIRQHNHRLTCRQLHQQETLQRFLDTYPEIPRVCICEAEEQSKITRMIRYMCVRGEP